MLPLALQKSSKLTSLQNKASTVRSNKVGKYVLPVLAYIVLWAVCSYIFYRRFPNNYLQPNFFGEEGTIFAKSIIENGFFHAFFTTFNGYYIWGIYILEKIAFVFNSLFQGGEFAQLPRAFSLVSYTFLGFIATLPLLLLRKYVKLPALILATLLVLFVPLGGWDYGVIGTFGNMKFALIFVAFLLLIYRGYLPDNSKKIYIVDFVLFICAYTNITIYIMMPYALLRYLPKLKRSSFLKNVVQLVKKDRSAQSLIVLGLAMIPQLLVIKLNGVPATPGYLDNPFNYHRLVEIFIGRAYLHEVLFPVNKRLNDIIVVALFIGFIALILRFGGKYRKVFFFGFMTIFFATFLFVIKRTGISDFYIGYKDPGPAQFFFAQNWIFGFMLSLLFAEIVSRIRSIRYRSVIYVAAASTFLLFVAPGAGSYGKNNFMEKRIGNIYEVSKKACESDKDNKIDITTYPSTSEVYRDIDRSQLCTHSVMNYQPPELSLDLEPFENNYISLGQDAKFTQTFTSPANNLSGLTIYFSTFMNTVKSPYQLKLYDASCKNELQSVSIKTKSLADNAYSTVNFKSIPDSAGKSYCFTIMANKSPADPLAVQLSAVDKYKEGVTNIGNNNSDKDVVFKLHYR